MKNFKAPGRCLDNKPCSNPRCYSLHFLNATRAEAIANNPNMCWTDPSHHQNHGFQRIAALIYCCHRGRCLHTATPSTYCNATAVPTVSQLHPLCSPRCNATYNSGKQRTAPLLNKPLAGLTPVPDCGTAAWHASSSCCQCVLPSACPWAVHHNSNSATAEIWQLKLATPWSLVRCLGAAFVAAVSGYCTPATPLPMCCTSATAAFPDQASS